MSNTILFTFIFGMLTLGIFVSLYRAGHIISEKIYDAERYIESSRKWPVTEGTVIELGLNLDYNWPTGENKRDAMDEKWLAEQRLDTYENLIFYGTLVRYQFQFQNTTYESRNIQIVPIKEQADLVMKLSIGSKIKVKFNPENPSECFIRKNSNEDVKSYGWMLMQSQGPKVVGLMGSLVIFIALIALNFA
jgi:hypothetical protein